VSTTITRNARDILTSEATVCDGNALTISGQLPAREYSEIKRVLEAAGARWNKRAQAHLFPGDAAEALAGLLAGDRVVSATEADQWFPTPPAIVKRLVDLAELTAGMEVLEPSAGEGAIAEAVTALGCLVDCIELNAGRAATLETRNNAVRLVTCADFLTVTPRAVYDRVVMNPPFAKLADARHVLHALKFVRPGGLLVSVMGNGITYRSDGSSARIRDMASKPGGAIIPLAAGSFHDSGTDIATVIVVLPVPGAAAKGEPVRVTFDSTGNGLPRFNPATAKPGTYVHFDAWTGADTVFRFTGNCTGCGVKTWRHDHGNDDVRGTFGDHTGMPMTDEDLRGELGDDVPEGTSFPRCSQCWNEYGRYRTALDKAVALFKAQQEADAGPATLF
jgi:predicted RNA methylase